MMEQWNIVEWLTYQQDSPLLFHAALFLGILCIGNGWLQPCV
jgi:hypothetical protein